MKTDVTMKSVVEIKKAGDKYVVNARGKWGGGWTSRVNEGQLYNTILRAWRAYGGNPRGIEIRGEIPESIRGLVDKLQDTGKYVITLRVSSAEAGLIKAMAESEGKSINQLIREKVFA